MRNSSTPRRWRSICDLPGDARLSPDGREVAFTVAPIGHPTARRTSAIYIAPTQGTVPAREHDRERRITTPARAGPTTARRLAFLSDRDTSGEFQLYRISSHGGEPQRLTSLTGGVSDPCWSCDDRLDLLHRLALEHSTESPNQPVTCRSGADAGGHARLPRCRRPAARLDSPDQPTGMSGPSLHRRSTTGSPRSSRRRRSYPPPGMTRASSSSSHSAWNVNSCARPARRDESPGRRMAATSPSLVHACQSPRISACSSSMWPTTASPNSIAAE